MDKVRVLNLFTIMDRGGAETMVMNYYRAMDKTKVQFDFMVHRAEKGAYDDEITEMGGKIYHMPPIRPWSSSKYRAAVSEFYTEHPEYKIIHSHMSELGYYDFIEAEKCGVPVRICHAHNRPYGFDLKTPVRWYYKTKMLPHITHCFTCGEEAGVWLFGEKNKNKFIQLNNAIDAASYTFVPAKRKQIREKMGLQDKLVVGHVGRFNAQKNHKFIIDIFEKIIEKRKDSVLLLVGEGEDKPEIENLVQSKGLGNNVRFLGTRSDVSDLLQAMDVFLFPSLFEGLSVASVEAQAAGLPCLISDKVPIECKKTDLVQQIALSLGAEAWADKVIEASEYERKNTFENIKSAGFDIASNAKWLEEFYINEYNKCK